MWGATMNTDAQFSAVKKQEASQTLMDMYEYAHTLIKSAHSRVSVWELSVWIFEPRGC